MKPSERIAARIVPHLAYARSRGVQFDPLTVITLVVAVVRLLIALWGLYDSNKARRRLERVLEPGRLDFFAKRWRRMIAEEIRDRFGALPESDIDAVIKGLADATDSDLIALRIEARQP